MALVDHFFLICEGCKRQKKVTLRQPITFAELDAWFRARPLDPCPCGAANCDVKAHVVQAN